MLVSTTTPISKNGVPMQSPTTQLIAVASLTAIALAGCGTERQVDVSVGAASDTARYGVDLDVSAGAGTVTDRDDAHDRRPIDAIVDGVLVLPDGHWELDGYGTVLDVHGDEITPRYLTGSTCTVGESFDNALDVDHVRDDGAVVIVDLAGPTTDYRLLPVQPADGCDTPPSAALDALDEVFATHFPFFAERGIDWSSEIETIRRDAAVTSVSAAFGAFVQRLGDGHTAPDDVDIESLEQRFVAYADPDARSGGDPHADIDRLVGDELTATLDALQSVRFDPTGNVGWGHTADGVGYLLVIGFEDAVGDGDPRSSLRALRAALDSAVAELAAFDALVVDVRFNVGGWEDLALAAAGYFTDEPTAAYRKWPHAQPDPFVQTVSVQPAQVSYDGDVAVLVSPVTASAAETFLLDMIAVTDGDAVLVGAASAGEFSDAIDWVLPDGTEFTMSMEHYTTIDGVSYEAVGVPVDVEAPFDTAFRTALDVLADRPER
jgi:Peptidase family S41